MGECRKNPPATTFIPIPNAVGIPELQPIAAFSPVKETQWCGCAEHIKLQVSVTEPSGGLQPAGQNAAFLPKISISKDAPFEKEIGGDI